MHIRTTSSSLNSKISLHQTVIRNLVTKGPAGNRCWGAPQWKRKNLWIKLDKYCSWLCSKIIGSIGKLGTLIPEFLSLYRTISDLIRESRVKGTHCCITAFRSSPPKDSNQSVILKLEDRLLLFWRKSSDESIAMEGFLFGEWENLDSKESGENCGTADTDSGKIHRSTCSWFDIRR